jgi:hypothetical protein
MILPVFTGGDTAISATPETSPEQPDSFFTDINVNLCISGGFDNDLVSSV